MHSYRHTALSEISSRSRIVGKILQRTIWCHALFFFWCGVYNYCCSVYGTVWCGDKVRSANYVRTMWFISTTNCTQGNTVTFECVILLCFYFVYLSLLQNNKWRLWRLPLTRFYKDPVLVEAIYCCPVEIYIHLCHSPRYMLWKTSALL